MIDAYAFLEAWSGAPLGPADGYAADELVGASALLPPVLYAWYARAGRRAARVGGVLQLEAPDALQVEDGLLTIYEDPLGDLATAVREEDLGLDDPPLVDGVDPALQLYPSASAFLEALVIFDALAGTGARLFHGEALRAHVARALPRLSVEPLRADPLPAGEDCALYGTAALLVRLDGTRWATAVARTPEAQAELDRLFAGHAQPGDPHDHADWLYG